MRLIGKARHGWEDNFKINPTLTILGEEPNL
jgi:hypothetical protein